LERAKTFASTFNIPRAYGSYQDVANDPEVEIIYICTLHPHHKAAAKVASDHGKAILCEKPLAMNATDAEAMIANARKNGTFFMEAMWSRYFPVIRKIRSLLKEGRIGDVVSFDAKLGIFANPEHSRNISRDHGASSLLDVGIYVITMASMVMGPGAPLEIHSAGKLSADGDFDVQFASVLKYPTGLATVQASFEAPLENVACICGTKGRIYWKNFWSPTAFSIINPDGSIELFDETTNPEYALPVSPGHVFNFFNSAGLAHEARYLQEALESGLNESRLETLDESITIMQTIDTIAKQIGFNNYS
jgi:dihydrodiol dehydrogenase / D-xylose 1-dehydrogenase (NADP)